MYNILSLDPSVFALFFCFTFLSYYSRCFRLVFKPTQTTFLIFWHLFWWVIHFRVQRRLFDQSLFHAFLQILQGKCNKRLFRDSFSYFDSLMDLILSTRLYWCKKCTPLSFLHFLIQFPIGKLFCKHLQVFGFFLIFIYSIKCFFF